MEVVVLPRIEHRKLLGRTVVALKPAFDEHHVHTRSCEFQRRRDADRAGPDDRYIRLDRHAGGEVFHSPDHATPPCRNSATSARNRVTVSASGGDEMADAASATRCGLSCCKV